MSIAAICTALAGCAQGCSKKNAAQKPPRQGELGTTAAPRPGTTLFRFDYETVTDFLIVKSDPASDDRWTARLRRPDPKSVDWEIQSGDDAHPVLDRKADGYFVLHLLDTLRTLQVTEVGVPGPESSLGLAPPRFALQWRAAATGAPSSSEFELRVGAQARGELGKAFGWVPGQAPFVMTGATLQMLEHVRSFESLRLKTWTGVRADDIDEVELLRDGKPTFYAQREGADWTDRGHKRLKTDVSAWLDHLTKLRVLKFIDDTAQAGKLRSAATAKPLREAVLKDRQGRATRLTLGGSSKQLIGLTTARPDGVFEVYPVTLKALEKPR